MQDSATDYDPIIFRNFEKHVQKTLVRFEALEKKQPNGKIIMIDPGIGTRIRKISALISLGIGDRILAACGSQDRSQWVDRSRANRDPVFLRVFYSA